MNINLSGIIDNSSLNLTGNGGVNSASEEKGGNTQLIFQPGKGEVFSGEIINVRNDSISILLNSGETVNAQMKDALSLSIGDFLSFEVKDLIDNQIILKNLGTEKLSGMMNDQTIRGALSDAGLPINDQNVSLVHNMMKQSLPIDKANLIELSREWGRLENATAKDVVILKKAGLELNAENVNALHDLHNFNDGISAHISSAAEDFSDFLSKTMKSEGPNGAVAELSRITEIFKGDLFSPESMKDVFSDKQRDTLAAKITELSPELIFEEGDAREENIRLQTKVNTEINDLYEKITEGNASSKEILNDIKELISKNITDKDGLLKLLEAKPFKELLKDVFKQEMTLNPSDFSKENLKKLMAKVMVDAKAVEQNFSEKESAAPFVQNFSHIKGEVQFTNAANSFMNFVQIPLKLSGKNAHGDLYVSRGRKGKTDNPGEISAFLHLDMDNLGPLDVNVKLFAGNVSTHFRVSDEKILDFLESNIDMLNKRLEKLGYSAQCSFTLTDAGESYSFEKNVFEREFPPIDIKRFTFDVRA